MNLSHSRYRTARRLLLFWTLFIGIGALAGGAAMLMDPTGRTVGMAGMLPYFQVLPFADRLFQDLTFSGIALIVVNGLTNFAAAGLLMKKKPAGAWLGGQFGVTLMLWICIQFYIFPLNFMSTIYFVFGLCQAATGWAAYVFQRQEAFRVSPEQSQNIGSDPTRLVVFFSRMGYVKAKAYEEADKTGADVYEIRAAERTDGTAGFWWCGRYGLHRWEMPIVPPDVDLTAYDHVTICAPVWVFSLAAPVRRFCREAAGKIKEVDYILVHHTNGRYENVALEMDRLLGIRHTSLRSIMCRMGSFREIRCAPSIQQTSSGEKL